MMGCGLKKVGNLLAELDSRKGIGLITRIRQGLGRPDRIYVRKCTQQDMYKRNIQTRQNDISGNAKMTGTDMSEMPGNDTEDNKTEISDTDRSDTEYLSFYSEESEEMHRKRMEREVYHQMILTNIGYEYLVDVYNRDMLNEIVELIVDTVCSEQEMIRIGGDRKPKDEEFELAQLVIGNQKQKGFARDAGFSLKGKVKCGNCGLKMMYNYGAMPVVYCGHTAAVGIMSTCDKTRYSAAKIERIVLVALRKQLEIFQSMAKILEEGEEKNKTNLPAMQRNMEQELEKLKAERIRQYEAYAEGVVNQETYLKNKKDLNEKIEIIQDKYEQIQEVTSVEDNLMKDIRIVEKNAEEVNILKKMTRHIAETFVEEITIYDSEKIEIRFVFDDLLIGMADRIKKKTEDIA